MTCLPWEKCSLEEAVLGSSSFLGNPELILFDTWQISGDGYQHIVVDFEKFYIVCDSSSDFELSLGGEKVQHCNMDMPKIVTSVYSYVQIDYQLARYPGFLQEGFFARFNILSNDPRFDALKTSTPKGSITFLCNLFEFYAIYLRLYHNYEYMPLRLDADICTYAMYVLKKNGIESNRKRIPTRISYVKCVAYSKYAKMEIVGVY